MFSKALPALCLHERVCFNEEQDVCVEDTKKNKSTMRRVPWGL